jgi:hypothetical protein
MRRLARAIGAANINLRNMEYLLYSAPGLRKTALTAEHNEWAISMPTQTRSFD